MSGFNLTLFHKITYATERDGLYSVCVRVYSRMGESRKQSTYTRLNEQILRSCQTINHFDLVTLGIHHVCGFHPHIRTYE